MRALTITAWAAAWLIVFGMAGFVLSFVKCVSSDSADERVKWVCALLASVVTLFLAGHLAALNTAMFVAGFK